ncbi:MAG: peptide ABC transporter substrate-binding protein, partial [Alicyclobacillaceae bacterium]|nr:peptide ABC transporter substrate-binding protein [Alicyclobacillaceae bacterium]
MKARWWATAAAIVLLAGGAIAVCWRGWGAGVAAAPDKQQDLVFWLGDEPSPLDPGLTGDQWSVDLLNAVEEGLMRADADLKPRPALAQRVEVSSDYTRFTFHLRQAVWSDGKPLTAEDFRYAWLRVLDPAARAPFAYLLYPIKGAQEYHEGKAGSEQVAVEAPDERTLRVTLGAPTPWFLSLTALPVYFPVRRDVVEAAGQAFGTAPDKTVSIGPFRLTSWKHGEQLVVKKNDTYWDAGHVRLKSVTFRIVKDLDARVRLYEAGDLDQTGVSGSQVGVWKGRPDSVDTPEASVFFLVFNPDRYPFFQNKNIRLAFSYALDRRQYVDTIWQGAASPAYGLVPPTIPGRERLFREENGDLFVDHRDEAARELLRAGLRELHVDALPPVALLVEDSSENERTAEW